MNIEIELKMKETDSDLKHKIFDIFCWFCGCLLLIVTCYEFVLEIPNVFTAPAFLFSIIVSFAVFEFLIVFAICVSVLRHSPFRKIKQYFLIPSFIIRGIFFLISLYLLYLYFYTELKDPLTQFNLSVACMYLSIARTDNIKRFLKKSLVLFLIISAICLFLFGLLLVLG